jgi:2-hydroxychromene-2-carboxylate isomerase
MAPTLTFTFDIVCPYAWMAAEAVETVAAGVGAAVRWRPVLLGGVFQAVGQAPVPAETWAAPKAALGHKDVLRQADVRGLPIAIPAAHPRRTVDAMRLLAGAPEDKVPALAKALFRAYWVADEDVADPAVLRRVAAEQGVDAAIVGSDAARAALFASTAAAVEDGIFGVPSFTIGDRLWWGADRLHLVASHLAGARRGSPVPTGETGRSFSFVHDFASPFSYLASTQVERVAAKHGAALSWSPILLGALFRDIGTPNVPMHAMPAAKQQYVAKDLGAWADWWGVELRWPSFFPVRTVLPLRASIVEPRGVHALYRAVWVDDRDVGRAEVCAAVLDEAGFDGRGIVEQTGDPGVKDRLKANTAAAQRAGVCGVPTFQLDDGMLIWGQDRIDLLERSLAGWRPADPEAR